MAEEARCIFKSSGTVVRGFGRGSRDLGCPTVLQELPSTIENGVYAGWAQLNDGPVQKMVMSLGWNPFYKNEKRSLEVHILNESKDDFYGERLTIVVVAYLRPERNFDSAGELIAAINQDIQKAKTLLDSPSFAAFANDEIFSQTPRLPF